MQRDEAASAERRDYGKLQGKTTASKLILSALAPSVMEFAMERIGISLSLAAAATLGAFAIITFGLIVTVQRAYRPSPI